MYIVINGGGLVGEYLAVRMLARGNDVAIIEQDRETADRLSHVLTGRYLVICGDGCMSQFQEDADIRHADVFVSTTGKDDANLVSCEIATRVFSVPRCIARVNNPKNLRIFREVGIECVSSTTLIANIIEEDAMLGGINALSSLSQGNVSLTEMRMDRMKNHVNEAGVLVWDIEMPVGSQIVAVRHADETDMEVVSSETRLFPGDTVVLASNTPAVDSAIETLKSL